MQFLLITCYKISLEIIMFENDFIYLGYADGTGTLTAPNWKWTPNTPEAIRAGIKEGYTAATILSMSHEPVKNKEEPLRRGPLVLDFDSKENPESAIKAAQSFVRNLCMNYKVDANCLRYWISGGKGCHVELPALLIGSEDGHKRLHSIYFLMARLLSYQCLSMASGHRGMIDMQMYCGGKGRLLRLENIKRPNGRYKVPVTAAEFLTLSPNQLLELTKTPRDIDTNHKLGVRSEALVTIYQDIMKSVYEESKERLNGILEGMNRCSFLTKCVEKAHELSEPEWWTFISIMAPLGKVGCELIHFFSRPHTGYSFVETNAKIDIALKENKPKTCSYIKEQGWVHCGPDCALHSPCDLWKRPEQKHNSTKFVSRPDGLFYKTENGLIKISSPIKVIAIGRDFEGWSWCRLVEIMDFDQQRKTIQMPMTHLDDSSKWLSILLDGGLLLESYPNARRLLKEYIGQGESDMQHIKLSENTGWMPTGGYLMPDIYYGTDDKVLYNGDKAPEFQVAGTLQEWKDNVGRYCSGNPLFVFVTAFALSGVVLTPLGVEGGGIHIYGGSSKGKSTLALVAGSVCGGGGQEGFIRQWRTTDNALERVAASHNDNFLVLDEIGQANSIAVYRTIYMLANGQGKMRMSSDIKQRKQFVWNLNFLSTGELTIGDKIREDGRTKVMAGQEVRILDIPIDCGVDENPLSECHDCSSPGDLSNRLKINAKRIYGSPLRSFLEILTADKANICKRLKQEIDSFYIENMPEGASQQVQRVLGKIALIAAVGELAIALSIFPYQKGEAKRAAIKVFNVWITQRQGVQDGEILAALQRIRLHFETHKEMYTPIEEANMGAMLAPQHRESIGYKYLEYGEWIYFTLTPTLNVLFGNINRKTIIDELLKRNWIATNRHGNALETKSVSKQNVRGLGFIPARML